MKEKLKILSKYSEGNGRRSPLRKLISSTWDKLVMEAQYRLSGSVSFSVIIHIFLLLGYLGLGALDQPSEPPIREITFIDMNEVEEEPEETVVKREAPPPVPTMDLACQQEMAEAPGEWCESWRRQFPLWQPDPWRWPPHR